MKNTSRSIKSNRSNNKVIGRKLSHKQLCERIEQLESTINQERVAAVEIELEARRTRYVEKRLEMCKTR